MLLVQNDAVEGFGSYLEHLAEAGAEVELLRAYTGSRFPASNYDAFLIGPTPHPANDAEKIPYLNRGLVFLQSLAAEGKLVLGVCCGGQILSRVLGGGVVRSPRREVGVYAAELTREGAADPLFRGFPRAFPVFHWHADMFTVPHGGALLARGDPCPNQAFRHGSLHGLTFHLEIGCAEASLWADAYPDELKAVGKTREQVLRECAEAEPEMRRLSGLLIRNLLSLA